MAGIGEGLTRIQRAFDRIASALGNPTVCMSFLLFLFPLFGGGFIFDWSPTYLLIIGLYLSVPPYCVMFVLLYTTNRDTLAGQVQMSEVIRALPGARNELMGLEKRPTEEIAALHKEGT